MKKYALAPPPDAEGWTSMALSFQAISGMYDFADALFASLVEFQYDPLLSLNSVPPTAVTSGMLAGASTERPGCVESPQSAAPVSPDAANQVMPCAFACRAQVRNMSASARGVSSSHSP